MMSKKQCVEDGRYYNRMGEALGYKAYLKNFYAKINELEGKGSSDTVFRADRIADIMTNLISEYKGIPCGGEKPHYDQWYEVLLSAIYIYCLIYNEENPFTSLVRAREYTYKYHLESGLKPIELEYVFQAVESLRGFNGPQKWKPIADSPSEMLVLAVFLENKGSKLYKPAD